MRLPFSLFDFLGYALPGLIVIILVILITAPPGTNQQSQIETWLASIQKLINPDTTSTSQQNIANSGLIKYLQSNIIWGIFFILFCYIVGFVFHGISDFCFKLMAGEYIFTSAICSCMKKYYTDNGWFEKELFDCLNHNYRNPSEHFDPYSNQFIRGLKGQIGKVFKIEVDRLERPVEYTEIFHLCRGVVIKQNPDLYSRASTLQSRHESAKLMMFIFFLATLVFLLKGFFSILNGELLLLYFAGASFVLGIVFQYMYNRLLRYYRNYILYGFYQYAMDLERSKLEQT